MPRTGQPAARQIASVKRAIQVLEVLATADTPLGTSEIARRTGLAASTVSRLVATFVAEGLAEYLPASGHYRLGLRMFQLGNAVVANLGLRDLARPHLSDLVEQLGETATLSVPGEDEPVTLDYVSSARSVRSDPRVGRASAPHATSVGKIFLAYGGPLPEGPLPGYTDQTITDHAQLREEAARVRERGWAEAVGEREEHLNGVAVPVVDRNGDLVAILGLQGPAVRFSPEDMRASVPQLQEHAAALGGG